MKQWHATLSCLSSTAWGKVLLFVGCRLTDQKKHHSLICRTILFAYSTARKKSLMWTSTTTFMLGCIALEKTRCKKHGQAILFFHRNFSEGCAIHVCDFHFPKNICKTVIVSISQKWVCDNRAVQKLPWSFYFHLPLWFSFLHKVFPFGINRYRAGAKVWQRALEIKGRAFGFRKNLHTVG